MVSIRTITIPVVCMIVTGSMAVALDWHFTEPNIALNKNTTQSSTGYNAVSNRAVDGNNSTDWYQGSCTHTYESGASAWWAVYLAGNYKVSGIIIYNREDLKERLQGFKVIGQSAINTSVVLYDDSQAPRNNELVIHIQLNDAQLFSSINITIPWDPLTLCEVQIFAACLPPTAPANGTYSPVQDGYGYSSMITVTCLNGYNLYGSNQMECQRNGSWSNVDPKCIDVSCSYPLGLRNGTYTYNWVAYSSGKRMLGDVITAVCDRGYAHTSGSSQRTCTYEVSSPYMHAEWNGTTPICSLITCPWPVTFSAGYYKKETQNTAISSLPYGTVIQATCNNGLFKIIGDETRTCGDNSIWSGVAPSCVVLCNAPNVTNGHYGGNGSVVRTQYELGQRINIICEDGYKLNTTNTDRTCGTDHQWNGGDVNCNVALCSPPNVTNGYQESGGSTIQNHYEQGQQINIICEDGYGLSTTNTERTCGTDHQWNGGDINCNAIQSSTEAPQGGSTAIIGGSAAGAVVLIVVGVVAGVMIYRRRAADVLYASTVTVPVNLKEHVYLEIHTVSSDNNVNGVVSESTNRDAEALYESTTSTNLKEHVYLDLNPSSLDNASGIKDTTEVYVNLQINSNYNH